MRKGDTVSFWVQVFYFYFAAALARIFSSCKDGKYSQIILETIKNIYLGDELLGLLDFVVGLGSESATAPSFAGCLVVVELLASNSNDFTESLGVLLAGLGKGNHSAVLLVDETS